MSPQSSLHLYPTVGLQTPGEIVEANFGESPFVFDFEGLLSVRVPIPFPLPVSIVSRSHSPIPQDVQQQIRQSIEATPVSDGIGSWQTRLNKLVLSYLVHHGYCRTAQVFASSTGQRLEEDMTSIRNRQSQLPQRRPNVWWLKSKRTKGENLRHLMFSGKIFEEEKTDLRGMCETSRFLTLIFTLYPQ